ncbi:MAG: DsrE/DsrF/DrsH-like family protein [Nitrososphaerales archaeon]
MNEKKKIVCLVTSGVDTPERTYAPFILATTAVAMGIEAIVYFFIKGITVVRKGEAEKIKIGDFPPLKGVMDKAVASGVRLLACDQSCQLMGLSRGEIINEAKVVGAAMLNDVVLDADAVIAI